MAAGRKLDIVNRLRSATDRAFLAMPLPKVNPNVISASSVVTGVVFVALFRSHAAIAVAFLALTLLLDLFDGLVAKKHNLCSEQGYMADVVCDRVSEGIIFSIFIGPWYWLFSLNCILTIYSFRKSTHIILPLRHLFLVYLLARMFLPGFPY